MRDVGDAVVVEHEARAQLRLGLRQLRVGDAVALRRGRAPRAAPLPTDASGVPSVAVDRHGVEERLLGRQQRRRTPTTRGRARPARDRAARCAAAAARGSSTRGSGPSRRSARRRESAAGRNAGRWPTARDSRPSGTPSSPSWRIVSRRSPVCSRLDACAGARSRRPGWMRAEVVLDAPQRRRRCRRRRR